MFRILAAYAMAIVLAFTGVTLASARGEDPVIGAELVICSGTTLTTIIIGPDGKPVEKSEPCPDGNAVFAATFSVPAQPAPVARLLMVLGVPEMRAGMARHELAPSARGPPEPA